MPSFVDAILAGRHAPDDEIRQRRRQFTLALLELLHEYAGYGVPATLFIDACVPYGLSPPHGKRLLAELEAQGLITHQDGKLQITLPGQHTLARLAAIPRK